MFCLFLQCNFISFQSFSLFFIENIVNFKVFTYIYAVLFTFVHMAKKYGSQNVHYVKGENTIPAALPGIQLTGAFT